MSYFINCLLLCLLLFFVGNLAQSAGRNRTDERNRKDACTNSRNNTNSTDPRHYDMVPYHVNNKIFITCGCNQGTFFVGMGDFEDPTSTICQPCPANHYMDKYAHNITRCFPNNSTCSEQQTYIPGNGISKHQCVCRVGFMGENGNCKPHSSCPEHYGVKTPGSAFYDVECEPCSPGNDSLHVSSAERCHLLSQFQTSDEQGDESENVGDEINENDEETENLNTMETLHKTKTPSAMKVLILGLTIGLGLACVIIICLIAYIFRDWRARKKTKKENNRNDSNIRQEENIGLTETNVHNNDDDNVEGGINDAHDEVNETLLLAGSRHSIAHSENSEVNEEQDEHREIPVIDERLLRNKTKRKRTISDPTTRHSLEQAKAFVGDNLQDDLIFKGQVQNSNNNENFPIPLPNLSLLTTEERHHRYHVVKLKSKELKLTAVASGTVSGPPRVTSRKGDAKYLFFDDAKISKNCTLNPGEHLFLDILLEFLC